MSADVRPVRERHANSTRFFFVRSTGRSDVSSPDQGMNVRVAFPQGRDTSGTTRDFVPNRFKLLNHIRLMAFRQGDYSEQIAA